MMSDTPSKYFSDHIHHLFAELNPQDVEQFYSSYQQWALQQQLIGLQAKIHSLQQHIAENNWRMQQVHPSPIALATLARLQSKGVTDIELLDRLLERGDIWLDQTMQHLEYCEQLDFMRDNYTEWCRNALDGAYDWIESIHEGDTAIPPSSPVEEDRIPVNGTPTGNTMDATEEVLLQKLMSEGVEEEKEVPTEQRAEDTAPVEVAEAEQLQEATISNEEPSKEQPQEEEAIIYFVDDLEMLPLEIVDEPVETEPVEQEAELEQTDPASMAAVGLQAEVIDDTDASFVPGEQTTGREHDDYVPAPEEVIPSEEEEANDTSDSSFISTEQETPSEHLEAEALLVSSEESLPTETDSGSEVNQLLPEHEEISSASESMVGADELTDTSNLPTVENDEVTSTSEKVPEDALESETNAPNDQSTPRGYPGARKRSRSPQKRTFLQRLFTMFRRR